MPITPASGLISPSPSITELDKAEDSYAVPKSANATTTDINGADLHQNSDEATEDTKSNENDELAEEKTSTTGMTQEITASSASAVVATSSAEVGEPNLDKKKPNRIPRSEKLDLGSDLESDDANSDIDSLGVLEDPSRRRKYIRDYGAYMLSLEKRISELEASKTAPLPIHATIPDAGRPATPLKVRRGSDASSSSTSSSSEVRNIIPELKFMTWEEYLVQKGRPIQSGSHAIDVLIDEPILYHQRTRKKHNHDGVAPNQAIEMPPSAARRCEGLPSRIRINSEMILWHLWKTTKKRFPLWKPNHPRIILRPYKMLYLYENDLRYLLADLESKLEDEREDPVIDRKQSFQETEKPGTFTVPIDSSTITSDITGGEGLGETHQEKQLTKDATNAQHGLKDVQDDFTWVNSNFEKAENTPGATGPTPAVRPPRKTFEEKLNSEEGIGDLKCLIKFIDDFLRPIQDEYDTCKREKVRFSELWHLLKPDQLAYVTETNCPQHIWRVVQVTGGRPYLGPYVQPPTGPPTAPGPPQPPPSQGAPKPKAIAAGYDEISPIVVDCEYIDYNGVRFGPIFRKFHIDPYEDELDIKSLTVVPYKYATKLSLIKEEELRARGEKFLEFTEPGHRYYSGKTLNRTPIGVFLMCTPEEGYYRPVQSTPVSEETFESEVIVDFDRTFNSNPNWAPRLGEDIVFEMMDSRETREPEHEENSEAIDYDMEWDRQMRNDIMAIINVQTQRYFSKNELPKGNDVLLLPSRVYAFILRSRKWAALDINNLRSVNARTNGFEDLELPSGHKDVVQALVQTHFRRSTKKGQSPSEEEDSEQFDLVRDKGKGLIILLHGAPGVGKSSTAECVAESNNVPLLPITCGDLGITAQDVERKLEMNFRLAQAWGCVLLLDEADVFLAQRSSSDLERNAVVSVFLRVLEYYEGILFLTTNRVGAFDEAFKSRIHLSLFYPWLNAVQTIKIWDMHMRRIKERMKTIEIDKEQILTYARLHFDSQCRLTGGTGWNGRQIRNAFQSAIALAQFESKGPSTPVCLRVRHFEIVAKAAAEFDDYLIRTTGHSDAERAAFNMIRTDTFSANPRNPMSWDSLTQGMGGYGQSAGATHVAFGGMGGNFTGNPNIQTAFSGNPNPNMYNTGGQGMPAMNMGSFGSGMSQTMPFQQSNYGMQAPSSAQASFMGAPVAQIPNQGAQMWPVQHHQGQGGVQQQVGAGAGGSMISMPRELSQVSVSSQGQGQGAVDLGISSQQPLQQQQQQQQQVPNQGQPQSQMGTQPLQPLQQGNTQQMGLQNTAAPQQGYNAAQGFATYPQGGQGAFMR